MRRFAPGLLFGVWLACSAPAVGQTQIVRPGACAPRPAVLYVVRQAEPPTFFISGDERVRDSVAVFLEKRSPGWASRHLLARFDLIPETAESIAINGGVFCVDNGALE